MIIINNINTAQAVAATLTMTGRVSSADEVVFFAITGSGGGTAPTVSVNGTNVPVLATALPASGDVSSVAILWHPPVGQYSATIAMAGTSVVTVTAISLLGVSKRSTTPTFATAIATVASATATAIQVASANSMVIDSLFVNDSTTVMTADPSTTQIRNVQDTLGNNAGVSYKILNPGVNTFNWALPAGSAYGHVVVALEPDESPSIWFPNDSLRSQFDTVKSAGLNTKITAASVTQGFGYYPSTFFQNSFLHTIGRIISPAPPAVSAPLPSQTSQIVIDSVVELNTSATTLTLHGVRVPSQDAVVAICVGDRTSGASTLTVNFNGTNIPAAVSKANGTNIYKTAIFYVNNPPVGSFDVVINDPGTSDLVATAITLLGIDKRTTTPVVASNETDGGTLSGLTITPASANSILIDCIMSNANPITADSSTTQVMNTADVDGDLVGVSFKIAAADAQAFGWNITGNSITVQTAIALEPAQAPSIWFPNIDLRNIRDVVEANALDTKTTPVNVSVGYFPASFFQNSFLHTIGRQLNPPTPMFSLAAETELETSQIVIDRITSAAQASATSITTDHLVTSQDAILLIFASNMGVSQSLNSVNLNGVPLNSLTQNNISTVVGGVYFINNPPVGVNTVSASVTLPASLQLEVFTFLGVDKKTTNPIVSTASGLTGSPLLAITPAAADSLVVDFVSSLSTSATEDTSQTPYLDQPQTASGAFGSIKLTTNSAQTMSWTTSGLAWVQFAIALEPANALSIWFPAIDMRNLSDVIQVNGLDESTNPVGNFAATYGNHPSTYWQNSFLHTVGRMPLNTIVSAQGPLELQLLGVG